jgi:hypothetical protein
MRHTVTWLQFAVVTVLGGFIGLSVTSADSIVGSVILGPASSASTEAEPDASPDYYWKVWNGALPPRQQENDENEVLAILTGKALGPPIGCTYSFRGGALSPSTIATRTGETARVQNLDPFTHELAVDGLPGFTPLESAPQTTRTITVPDGGPWRLRDKLYGHVDGYLHSMRELVACAAVDDEGKFRFEGVPAGPYSLRFLRGPEQVAAQKIVVEEGVPLELEPLTLDQSGGE